MTSRVLALDPATRTGWAFAREPFTDRSRRGVLNLAEHAGNRGALFVAFRRSLHELVDIHRPELVLYETPTLRNFTSIRLQFGLCALIEALAYDCSLMVASQGPTTIKAWATGKGNADKHAMLAAARRLELPHDGHDDADAQLLLSWFVADGKRQEVA